MDGNERTAGRLVRRAREEAGLSQSQLAERAGVTQSVVSVYESGRRQPSLPMLERLLEATGGRLRVEVDQSVAPAPSGPRSRVLHRHRDEVARVARRHGVSRIRLFGSVVRGQDTEDSDIDLLVDLPSGAGLFALMRLKRDLEEVLGCSVDVVPEQGLKDEVIAAVASEAVPL